jgi:hydrophobic/amphiphilic exporter-1 (mainly G- bacteria), HAE1 family
VVFGGMMASTLLAIPFVPVFYVLLERAIERVRGKGSELAGGASPPQPTNH